MSLVSQTKHISLSELLTSVKASLESAFPLPVWVAAEIADLKVNGAGHCYMELVEKGGANSVPRASARAVAWRSQWQTLSAYFRTTAGSALEAGMKVLVRVVVSYHELYGFSLVVSDIDPSYTLGERERQRQETIKKLQADGVWDMNRQVGFPLVVQRIAVVSSSGAAGWRDFLQELGRYPYNFAVTLFEATMQGHATENSIVEALAGIAQSADEFDAVVIIRGGGSQSDLAAFDGYVLCSHIAQFPLPILTGIGHDKDRSVADMVAAEELKTPTAVAVWLGERISDFDGLLDSLSDSVREEAWGILEREKVRLERLGRVVSTGAVEMTRRLEVRLERLGAETVRRASEYFLRENNRLAGYEVFLTERPSLFLSRLSEKLVGYEGIISARRPDNILALGFSIVRANGRAVTDPATLAPDTPIEITLAKGKMKAKTI